MKQSFILDITGKVLFSNKLQGQSKINMSEQVILTVLYFMSTSFRGIIKKRIK